MKALIVEDEPLAQAELKRMIALHLPQLEVVATLDSVVNSVAWLRQHEVELIFMDIHLSDGNGFEIFKQVEVKTPVIFTTAYDQYAIEAFKVNGIGYLLKPLVAQELVAAVAKLQVRGNASTEALNRLLQNLSPSNRYKSRIMIRIGDKFNYLAMDEVAYFFAEDKVTYVVSQQGRRYIVDYTIEALEPLLNPQHFFRLSRAVIAAITAIHGVSKYFNSRLRITLQPPHEGETLVSRARVHDFLRWLDGE